MMRVCFLFAIKATTDLDALPEAFAVQDFGNGNGLTLRHTTEEYPDSDYLLRLLGAKTIGGSTWLLVLCLPVSLDWRHGARAFRFLRRVSLAHPTRLAGPWSLRQFAATYPAVAATVLGTQQEPPVVIAGDEPTALPVADYRPSDADCSTDTEPDPETIFGA